MVEHLMFATVEGLADYIGEPVTDDVDMKRMEMAIAHASVLVSDETKQTWADEAVPSKVTMITLAAASRVYLNLESWGNEGLDDWRGGGRPIEEVGLYLTGTEKRSLAVFRPVKPRLGTVGTFRGDLHGGGASYVPTAPPGEPQTPIPWW